MLCARAPLCWLLVAGLVGMASCRDRTSAPLPILRIGHAPHDHHAPLYVAALRPGYFRDHGGVYLDAGEGSGTYRLVVDGEEVARVQVGSATGGAELVRRLAEDQYDLAFGGFPAMLRAIDQGAPLRVVAPVMAGGNGLVVRRDLDVADWRGFVSWVRSSPVPVRIGYKAAGSVQDQLFEEALEREGLSSTHDLESPAQVRLLNLHGAQNLLPALQGGLLDGFVVMQPYLARAEASGAGRTVALLEDLAPDPGGLLYPCCALAARTSVLERQPRAVEQLLTLLLRASGYIPVHPDDAAAAVATWLGGDAAVERRALATIHFTTELDPAWERGADAWVRLLARQGNLPGDSLARHGRGELWPVVYDRAMYQRARDQL